MAPVGDEFCFMAYLLSTLYCGRPDRPLCGVADLVVVPRDQLDNALVDAMLAFASKMLVWVSSRKSMETASKIDIFDDALKLVFPRPLFILRAISFIEARFFQAERLHRRLRRRGRGCASTGP
jgi:hypothetical protein